MSDASAPRLTSRLAAEIQARRRRLSLSRRRIAVVGMACRFPGGADLAAFRELLAAGRDAVTRGRPDDLEVDPGTREAAPFGAYLRDLDRFDAGFFGIAPVEAKLMDPQHRLLLETSWEALEDAGLDAEDLRGSRTGVYAGISTNDYRDFVSLGPEPDPARSLYVSTGSSLAAAIGRIAFTLGFEGPAIAMDTACSSSLVAIHQAIAGLQRGEADLALAGGVNAILNGGLTRVFEEAGMLSRDGRCRTFDARAAGYVRGEGCGVLVLKRLGDAERDGDRIQGVLLGSAVNQDGASAGFTVPRGQSQERLMRDALARADVEPSTVDYLEAHGTGTELGDPIEVQAAAAVYGEDRPAERPLLLGSVKTNVGHLEAAAGVAGVVKVLLAMREGRIPKHLHFESPNPRLDWDALPVRVTAAGAEWPDVSDRPVRAAVSSFGFSGTNAHVILEAYGATGDGAGAAVPERGAGSFVERSPRLLPLSARTPPALRELAGRYLEWTAEGSGAANADRLADAAWTAGVGRSHFAVRAGLVFREAKDLREQLGHLVEEGEARATGPPAPPRVAFLYTGQGSQLPGMGRDLYEQEPVFRETLDRCEAVFREEREESLLQTIFARDGGAELGRTEWAQPALFALAAGLTELWSSLGVRPDAVLGHSVGEIAAAWAAGAFGLEAGLRFAARRGALMGSLPDVGAMTAVFPPPDARPAASLDWARGLVEETNRVASGVGLSLAADNGTHVVLSGPAEILAAAEERCREEGARSQRLATSRAFHSGLLDPILPRLEAAAEDLGWSAPRAVLVGNVTGRPLPPGKRLTAGYWRRQARSPVQFAAGAASLGGLGVGALIEIGPRAVLGPLAVRCWPAATPAPAVVTSLGRPGGFAAAVAGGYEAGLPIRFSGLFVGERRRRIALPTYPFQRERHWAPAADAVRRKAVAARASGDRVRDSLYALDWREVEGRTGSGAGPQPGPGTWLLAASGKRGRRAAGTLAEWLRERGAAVRLGEAASGSEEEPRPRDRGAWRSLALELARETPLAGVVWLGGLDGRGFDADAGALREDLGSSFPGALALVQGLSDAGAVPRAGTWLVTRGAQVVGAEAGEGPLWASALWGFGRAAGRELADLGLRLVDLDPLSEDGLEALAAELLESGEEPEIALRGGRRWAPRLVRLPAPRADSDPVVMREDRSYLVTGGFGGIGLRVAGWLIDGGAGAVVLNGRRPPTVAEEEAIRKLGAGGTEVRVEIADVTDEDAVSRLVRGIGADSRLPPLGGVIHSVGVLSDGSVANLDWNRFGAVLWPKVLGAWNLHRTTREQELDLFVLFSSVSGIFGTPGQSNYAAANAFLDQLALHRRSSGLPGQAIQWGAWSGVGEAEEARGRIADRLSSLGVGWLTPEEGLRALDRLIRADAGSAAAFSMDWEALGAKGLPRPPMLSELVSGGQARAPAGELALRLGRIPAGEREGTLRGFLAEEVRSILDLDFPPAAETGFFDLGMDSLTAVELRSRVNRALEGVYVAPNTVALDYPTVSRLARHLGDALAGVSPRVAVPAPTTGPDERIAVVGMGCRFPGGENPEAFWALLAAGREAVRRGRPDDLMLRFPGVEASPWGGYVEGLDRFDEGFFRIAPVEAETLDPQQRLLLEVSWEALEDAGLDPSGLVGSRGGVYLGIGSNDYQRFVMSSEPNLYHATGTSFAAAIGRVAFVLGLEGPAIAVDTACSSSLTAIHQAVAALQRGEADFALAGGVNAILMPGVEEALEASGVLSPDGRCKTFDARADGYVRGEGCGVLVLKRLSDAERDGDRILGVLLGSAVNQDGASAGLTVPNGPAQERVIREALARAGVEASSVDYLEAHGTGTELGDPIEVQAAAAVYGEGREPERPLLLGSVKTNVGHLEAAAGVAGVVKALLSMRHGRIPPHLHFETPNPRIAWDSLPVRVTADGADWPAAVDRPRRAAVSSFGLSGTNAHVILEAPPGAPVSGPAPLVAGSLDQHAPGSRPRLLPLSARTPEALGELAGRYLDWLGTGERSPEELADAAWTASVGRSHFKHRAAILFGDLAAFRAGLVEVAHPGSAALPEVEPESEVAAAARAYEAGEEVAFGELFAGEMRQRIALPTYPFQRKRHWVRMRQLRDIGAEHALLGVRHELANGDAPFEQELGAGRPAWISDHRVFGRVVVPGAFYGAQAVAALRANGAGGGAVRVDDVRFERPLVLPQGESGESRLLQFLLDGSARGEDGSWEVFSRGSEADSWLRHASGRVREGALRPPRAMAGTPERLRAIGTPVAAAAVYRGLGASGIGLGPSFRALVRLWAAPGEVLGELALPGDLDPLVDGIHPVLLDACFQTVAGLGRESEETEGVAWFPVGWDRLWLTGPAPDRLYCHVCAREADGDGAVGAGGPETRRVDLVLHGLDGEVLGEVRGLALRPGTRASLARAADEVADLLHEVTWREASDGGAAGPLPADFLLSPAAVLADLESALAAPEADPAEEKPDAAAAEDLGRGLEEASRVYVRRALGELGWKPRPGDAVSSESLRRALGVAEGHARLWGRMLALLEEDGLLVPEAEGAGWRVAPGLVDSPPHGSEESDGAVARLLERRPEGSVEIALLRRCGGALAEVLRGQAEPLDLLFGAEPSAADLYRDAPGPRALNRMVAESVARAVAGLPAGRRLQVLEVGAGTGGTTGAVLPALPAGRTDYLYTDVSAGFLGEATARFSGEGARIEVRVLDIERDPGEQEFPDHGADLVLAANVLHATRDLGESLSNCRRLLAPAGLLVVLEAMEPLAWLDLTFGLLPGWWRFADAYRKAHPLVPPPVWRRALADAGYEDVAVLGARPEDEGRAPAGVVLARAPEEIPYRPGVWVVAPGEGAVGELNGELNGELERRDQRVIAAPSDSRDDGVAGAGPDRAAWAAFFAGLKSEPLAGVAYLGEVSDGGAAALRDEVGRSLSGALALSQGLLDAGVTPRTGLWLVTRGGQMVGAEPGARPAGAALWGFGRSAARELRNATVRLLDLDPRGGTDTAGRLAETLVRPGRELELAQRGEGWWAPRLVRAEPRPAANGSRVRGDRSYLVTGGFGGIGLRVADWLLAEGAGAVVLNGRRPPDPAAAEEIARLRDRGGEVRTEIADASDPEAVFRLVEGIGPDSGLPALGGVIHSVGVLADASLANQDWPAFERVLWPKVLGAWSLHRATESLELDLFVLFSSLAGLIGSPGQTNHAAANAFLDQLALYRRSLGLAGQTIQWGPWSGVGEAEEQRERIGALLAAGGVEWITPAQGIRGLDRLVREDTPASAVAAVDWSAFARAAAQRPLLSELVEPGPAAAPPEAGDLGARLAEANPAERERLLLACVREELQAVLRLPEPPPPDVGFFELGMDSLTAVEFRNRLDRRLGDEVTVPNTAVFDPSGCRSSGPALRGRVRPRGGTGGHGAVAARAERGESGRDHRNGVPIPGRCPARGVLDAPARGRPRCQPRPPRRAPPDRGP